MGIARHVPGYSVRPLLAKGSEVEGMETDRYSLPLHQRLRLADVFHVGYGGEHRAIPTVNHAPRLWLWCSCTNPDVGFG